MKQLFSEGVLKKNHQPFTFKRSAKVGVIICLLNALKNFNKKKRTRLFGHGCDLMVIVNRIFIRI